jgi:hypothetical protein
MLYLRELKDNEMPKRERRLHDPRHAEEIARNTKQRLVTLITVLIAILLALTFGVGQVLWSAWIIEHRNQIIGVIGWVLLAVIVSAPIIIEFNRNPRHLSGPGKDPRQGWGP